MISRHAFERSPVSIALLLVLSTATTVGAGACSDDDDANLASQGEAGADAADAGAGGEDAEGGSGGTMQSAGGTSGGTEGGEGGDRSSGGEVGDGGVPGAGGVDAGGAGGDDGSGGEPGIVDDGADDASSARYRLMRRGSGKCARMTAAKVLDVVDCDDGDDTQEFFLDPGAAGKVRARSAVQVNQCVHVSEKGASARSCSTGDELEFVKRANGGLQLKSATGHCLIESAGKLGGGACDDSADWELQSAGENFALTATLSASTTFGGYSVDYVHDGDVQLGLEGQSWTNAWNTPDLPATISIDLGQRRQFSRVDFYTSTGYEIAQFDIDWYDGSAWNSIAEVTGNVAGHLVFVFPSVVARELRVVAKAGPASQPNYARVNEVVIH